jgi:hypothetical protein
MHPYGNSVYWSEYPHFNPDSEKMVQYTFMTFQSDVTDIWQLEQIYSLWEAQGFGLLILIQIGIYKLKAAFLLTTGQVSATHSSQHQLSSHKQPRVWHDIPEQPAQDLWPV